MQRKYAKGRAGDWFVDADFCDNIFSLFANLLLCECENDFMGREDTFSLAIYRIDFCWIPTETRDDSLVAMLALWSRGNFVANLFIWTQNCNRSGRFAQERLILNASDLGILKCSFVEPDSRYFETKDFFFLTLGWNLQYEGKWWLLIKNITYFAR